MKTPTSQVPTAPAVLPESAVPFRPAPLRDRAGAAPSTPADRLQLDAARIFELLHQAAEERRKGMDDSARAKEDEAAGLLNRDPVRRWLVGYFRKRRVHAVEDLVQDVQVKLLVGRYCVESNAFAALCVVARSRLIDHIRASARHRAVDVELDVDQVAELQCTSDHTDPSLRLATRRALERMMVERPEKALLLELAAMGHSYKEVASLLLKKPQAEVTELEIGQVRDRIHHARRAARRYLGDEV